MFFVVSLYLSLSLSSLDLRRSDLNFDMMISGDSCLVQLIVDFLLFGFCFVLIPVLFCFLFPVLRLVLFFCFALLFVFASSLVLSRLAMRRFVLPCIALSYHHRNLGRSQAHDVHSQHTHAVMKR